MARSSSWDRAGVSWMWRWLDSACANRGCQRFRFLVSFGAGTRRQDSLLVRQIRQKAKSFRHTGNHASEIGLLVLTQEIRKVSDIVIGGAAYPLTEASIVEGATAAPELQHRQRTNEVSVERPSGDLREIVQVADFRRWLAARIFSDTASSKASEGMVAGTKSRSSKYCCSI